MKNEAFNDFTEMFDVEFPPEANLSLADPQLMNFYMAYKNRYLYIDKEIDDTLFEEMRMIMNWNKQDNDKGLKPEERQPIKMYIHSYGGNLDSCLAMIAIMNASITPIWTINLNCAMSAGGLLLINGNKGHRYAMKNSAVLIHSGSSSGGGTASFEQTVAQTENYKKLIQMVRENIIENTNISKQQLSRKSKNEWFIYTKEALELGIIDKVVDDLNEIL